MDLFFVMITLENEESNVVASMASSSVNVSFKSFGAFFLSTEIERYEEYTEIQRGVFLTFGILALNTFCNYWNLHHFVKLSSFFKVP